MFYAMQYKEISNNEMYDCALASTNIEKIRFYDIIENEKHFSGGHNNEEMKQYDAAIGDIHSK